MKSLSVADWLPGIQTYQSLNLSPFMIDTDNANDAGIIIWY